MNVEIEHSPEFAFRSERMVRIERLQMELDRGMGVIADRLQAKHPTWSRCTALSKALMTADGNELYGRISALMHEEPT